MVGDAAKSATQIQLKRGEEYNETQSQIATPQRNFEPA